MLSITLLHGLSSNQKLRLTAHQPLKTLSTISHSFPSLIHQELNLEINISNRLRSLQPAATLTSSLDIWNHIWKETAAIRLTLPHLVPQPRLRALHINAGSFRQTHSGGSLDDNEWKQYEQREQQTFRVRRHEHEDKARKGIAEVTSVQVQYMENKIGIGPVTIPVQSRMLEEARERAENGVLAVWDRRVDRGGPSIEDVRDNDYVMHLMMDSVMARFDEEELWLSRES